jgi:hypothetical protein
MSTIKSKLENIVSFELVNSGSAVRITESCDYYYQVELSKSELGELILELRSLYAEMTDA